MLNLPAIITPLRTYLYGRTSFCMEVVYLQHLLIEYLEKYNFLKIPLIAEFIGKLINETRNKLFGIPLFELKDVT